MDPHVGASKHEFIFIIYFYSYSYRINTGQNTCIYRTWLHGPLPPEKKNSVEQGCKQRVLAAAPSGLLPRGDLTVGVLGSAATSHADRQQRLGFPLQHLGFRLALVASPSQRVRRHHHAAGRCRRCDGSLIHRLSPLRSPRWSLLQIISLCSTKIASLANMPKSLDAVAGP